MFLYLKWYVRQRTSSAGFLTDYREEINRLKAEIDVVTERNITLVEDSIKRLKEIQDDADRRVSNYVNELEKSRKSEELYTNLGKGIRAALKTEAAPPLSVVMPNITPVVQPPVIQQPAVEIKPLASEVKPEPAQKPSSKRQIRAFIDQLANEGLPPNEIASRLDISIAEVDLAMNLRRRN
jgi:hypothetical protein